MRQPSQYIQQHHIRKIFFENPLGEGTANFACTNDCDAGDWQESGEERDEGIVER